MALRDQDAARDNGLWRHGRRAHMEAARHGHTPRLARARPSAQRARAMSAAARASPDLSGGAAPTAVWQQRAPRPIALQAGSGPHIQSATGRRQRTIQTMGHAARVQTIQESSA
eukprot:CAMPEP_0176292824 /NCGR_PEP_ID=MMETSP0121_2-20121125/56281_1 /TAXON_ID=160619 /ORGANISM="Kryptoperidinium foliaceum, Strain CCMP 1326" /LENGTH=113 /DNA_ID=CAMNT_0017633745 /DNA_START=69 /DNA_END=407 /DNA_ORIENTATION=+